MDELDETHPLRWAVGKFQQWTFKSHCLLWYGLPEIRTCLNFWGMAYDNVENRMAGVDITYTLRWVPLWTPLTFKRVSVTHNFLHKRLLRIGSVQIGLYNTVLEWTIRIKRSHINRSPPYHRSEPLGDFLAPQFT